ncbi:MAG: stress-induced protein, KGG, repeat-containing protein [Spirobacillus cienkowskii]|jgi:general stress protein YciG|uniref:Stress-induced protein, KGG, repeat-containing protein n=1 Tax=Spirobacillus cienkowskii TaxID=495820 RepID=A0A369KMT2_9BACT|nr:MAG: stress-induced protein, KGG, repeat-containing protein [Spirobacillus cienkowskii]
MNTNNKNISNSSNSGSKMTAEEMGRKGGEATAATHGKEFYREIGHKGGEKRAEQMRKAEEEKGSAQSNKQAKNSENENDNKE